jgi:uncharacterized protein YjbI with pentapeptide repeats
MVNQKHLEILLKQGVVEWNRWRQQKGVEDFRPDLTRADLDKRNLNGANLNGANLNCANLSRADLSRADFAEANLYRANLHRANLSGADLNNGVSLAKADLAGANLTRASFIGADLSEAELIGADLTEAKLSRADLEGAILTGCRIYGISAWDLEVSNETKQSNLIISNEDTGRFMVADIEVAQFIYLLRTSKRSRQIEKIRKVLADLGIEAEDIAKVPVRIPDAPSTDATSGPEKKAVYMSEPNGTLQSEVAARQDEIPERTAAPERGEVMRLRYGFWIILVGIGTVAVLFLALIIMIAAMGYETRTSDMAAILSSVIGVVGTLVGTFFGHQLGSAGKEEAEASRQEAQKSTMVALTMLPPDAQEEMRRRLAQ